MVDHLKSHKGFGWIKLAKYTVFGLVLLFMGNIIGKAVAGEGKFLEDATSMYVYSGVFDGTALLVPAPDGNGMATMDMEGVKLIVVQYPDCAVLVVDFPLGGPQIVGCVPNTLEPLDETD